MHDLAEHFDRLAWVIAEISRLEEELKGYTDRDPLQVYWHYDFHPTYPMRNYKTRLLHPVPRGVQIRSGTILNELRAILDALACTLAVRNGAADISSTYFPTGKDKATFETRNVQRKIRYLSEQDKQTIAALKPYGGGNDMLYALHSTDIIRKHQRLIVMAAAPGTMMLGADNKPWTLVSDKVDYIKNLPTLTNEPFASLTWDYHIVMTRAALVTFAEPDAIKTKPVVTTLNEFSSLVESILKLFVR